MIRVCQNRASLFIADPGANLLTFAIRDALRRLALLQPRAWQRSITPLKPVDVGLNLFAAMSKKPQIV